MDKTNLEVGSSFSVQFIWQLPNNDFIRAIFKAEVLELMPSADKYVVRLSELVAGRQESASGETLLKEELSSDYWALVGRIQGRRATLAYESDDGRPLRLRLATLTGKHTFFFRLDPLEEVVE